jgi:acetoin:2,6-dichlorophenolindophenol oxidoreductase subunit alpha
MTLTKELQLEMLRRMWLIRLFDEASARLVETGEIGGEVHLSIGQEAAVVGACMAIREDDYMTGNHRSHGHPIGKGSDVNRLMAELMGKGTGICRGKGGSMHLADFAVGSLGESGIVASAMPVAVGAGLSSRLLKQDRVVLCFFGDGAVNEGACHEAMNLAAVWDLPVIFLCENNQYAVSMAMRDITAVKEHLAERAAAYDIPGVVVDGQDAMAVHQAVSEAAERGRRGDGPTFVETLTYRFDEHAFALPMSHKYRPDEEVEYYKTQRDPIVIHGRHLVDKGVASQEEVEDIAASAQRAIDEAVKFGLASAWPSPEERFEDMYAQPFPVR